MLSRDRPVTVRLATRADEPDVMRLLHLMHAEGGMGRLDEGSAREMFDRAFDRKGGIIGAIDCDGKMCAMIYLLITRWWYTLDNHLEELFNFVHPDYRHTNYAISMIDFAKKCSDDLSKIAEFHIPLVIGVLTSKRMAAKVRMYRKSLGYPSGAVFVHNARWMAGVTPAGEDFWTGEDRGKSATWKEEINRIRHCKPETLSNEEAICKFTYESLINKLNKITDGRMAAPREN